MVHVALPERRAVTTTQKNHPSRNERVSASHNQPHPNLNQKDENLSNYGITGSSSHWMIELSKVFFRVSSYTFSIYS